MAEKTLQTYANHARIHPPFHFFLAPGSIVLLILTVVNVVRHYGRLDAWILLLIGIFFLVAVFLLRLNRAEGAGPADPAGRTDAIAGPIVGGASFRIEELTESQLIALRFASDSELPALVAKVLATGMKSKDIKQAIVTWRGLSGVKRHLIAQPLTQRVPRRQALPQRNARRIAPAAHFFSDRVTEALYNRSNGAEMLFRKDGLHGGAGVQ